MTAAMSQGRAASGTVMWMPLAGRIECGLRSSSRARTSSAQTPPALTTTEARMSKGVDPVRGDRRSADPPAVVGHEAGHRRVVGGHRTVVEHRGAQDGEGEPGVVGPGVPVEEAGRQPVGPEGGHVGQGLLPGDLLVAPADPDPTGQVVEPQGGPVHTGHTAVDHPGAPEEGDEEGERGDQMGRVVEQALALGEVLVDQPVLVLLEVAEPAVDELGGLGRGARGEVALLDQGGPQSPAGCVEGHPGPGDARLR